MAKGVPHLPEFKTEMVHAQKKSEDRRRRYCATQSSKKRVASWYGRGDFNESGRSRSCSKSQAGIQKPPDLSFFLLLL